MCSTVSSLLGVEEDERESCIPVPSSTVELLELHFPGLKGKGQWVIPSIVVVVVVVVVCFFLKYFQHK